MSDQVAGYRFCSLHSPWGMVFPRGGLVKQRIDNFVERLSTRAEDSMLLWSPARDASQRRRFSALIRRTILFGGLLLGDCDATALCHVLQEAEGLQKIASIGDACVERQLPVSFMTNSSCTSRGSCF